MKKTLLIFFLLLIGLNVYSSIYVNCDTTFALQRAEIVYQPLQDFVETVFTPITIEKGYRNRNSDNVLITIADDGTVEAEAYFGYAYLPNIAGYKHVYSISANGVDIIVAHNSWSHMFKPISKHIYYNRYNYLLVIAEDELFWTLKINGDRLEFVDFYCYDTAWFDTIPRYRIMPLANRILRIPICPPASILDSCRYRNNPTRPSERFNFGTSTENISVEESVTVGLYPNPLYPITENAI